MPPACLFASRPATHRSQDSWRKVSCVEVRHCAIWVSWEANNSFVIVISVLSDLEFGTAIRRRTQKALSKNWQHTLASNAVHEGPYFDSLRTSIVRDVARTVIS